MEPLIIANWKMNLTFKEALNLTRLLSEHNDVHRLVIAPPTPYIAYLAQSYQHLDFCAQDVSINNAFGPYTGESSAKFFKSCGVNYSLIGHSERRTLFGETNEIVRKKVESCLDNQIIPIICIGESEELRNGGNYKEFLLTQLEESLPKTDKHIIIAYEPVWAIGTKIIPTTKQISEVTELIKTKYQSIVAKTMQLVYGGSVNSENCKDILNIKDISGVLVGGASLNKDELFKILNS
jgi:triosephosphate isomerase